MVGRVLIARHVDARVRYDDDWCPLHSRLLADVLGAADRRPVLDELIGGGVLECDTSYVVGRRSRRYRLTPAYRAADYRQHTLTGPVARRVREWRAERHVAGTRTPVWARLAADLTGRVTVAEDWPRPAVGLAVMAGGDWHYGPCAMGRYHTNLTNLDSSFRRFVRVDGKPVWAVDVANSQPLLLGLTLRGRAAEGYQAYAQMLGRAKGANTIPTTQPPTNPPTNQPPTQHYPHMLSISHFSHDFDSFITACLSGRVYGSVLAAANALKTRGEPYTRQEIKAKLLTVFYGSARDMNTLAGQAFRSLWEGVYDALLRAKLGARKGDKPGAELAREMQRRESHLIIWRAAARFHREFLDVPLLTCHDSFMTTDEHIHKAEAVLKAEYLDAYGVVPTTTVKPW